MKNRSINYIACKFLIIFSVFLLPCIQKPASAAGNELYEFGTAETSLAAAGFAARALDGATVYTNPAGMLNLEGQQFMIGARPLYGDVDFQGETSDGNGGNPVRFVPAASFFYSNKISEDLAVGIAGLSHFGLTLDYQNKQWAGRYYLQEGNLIGYSILPSIAYRLTDKLSLGAGLNVMYGTYKNTVAVNNGLDQMPDGSLAIDDHDIGYGGNFGLMYQVTPDFRAGFTYKTAVNLEFKDQPRASNLGPVTNQILMQNGLLAQRGLEIDTPQTVTVSTAYNLRPDTIIYTSLNWQDWSDFGTATVSFGPNKVPINRHYKDTYHASIGLQQGLTDNLDFLTGFAYDTSCLDDSTMTADFPTDNGKRVGVGFEYKFNASKLGLGYEIIFYGDQRLNQYESDLQGQASGTFRDSTFHFLALYYSTTI